MNAIERHTYKVLTELLEIQTGAAERECKANQKQYFTAIDCSRFKRLSHHKLNAAPSHINKLNDSCYRLITKQCRSQGKEVQVNLNQWRTIHTYFWCSIIVPFPSNDKITSLSTVWIHTSVIMMKSSWLILFYFKYSSGKKVRDHATVYFL